jgi:hypothetical protein
MRKTHFLVFLFCLFLWSCDEDDSNNEGSSTDIVNEDGILLNLKSTNLDDIGFPWYNVLEPIDDFKRLKTWNTSLDGLIPVKTGGFDLAEEALNVIESEVGKVLFDRQSIANTPNDQITRGIIVSQGTALGAFGSTTDPNACGHVSEGIGTTAYPFPLITYEFDPDTGDVIGYTLEDGWYDSTGNINTVLYVHIGAASCENPIDLDLVVHEFGHALGMGAHFEGFGFGPAVDGNFWNVLHTMYNNPTGTLEDNITINQIKF